MNSLLRGIGRGLFQALKMVLWIAAGYLVLLGIYLGYSAYREPIAKADAQRFCASIKVGEPADGIVKRALEAGSEKPFTKWHSLSDKYQTTNERQLLVIFTGAPPFSRHICDIHATDVVLSAKYNYMD